MNKMREYQILRFLLAFVLAIGLVFGTNPVASADPLECINLDITGSYTCSVACIARDDSDGLMGFTASEEKDTIEAFAIDTVGESEDIYKVEIASADGKFTETEIGPLVGCTLYTATESVSDNQFPVLEEYIFEEDFGPAESFTKVVRNPNRGDFKTCKVECLAKVE